MQVACMQPYKHSSMWSLMWRAQL